MMRASTIQTEGARHPDSLAADPRRIAPVMLGWLSAAGALAGCSREPAKSLSPDAVEVPLAADPPPRPPGGPPAGISSPEGMVWIPGGTFWMGADDGRMKDAEPVH